MVKPMLNKALILNPLNWAIIFSMILLAGYVAHLILSHYHNEHP